MQVEIAKVMHAMALARMITAQEELEANQENCARDREWRQKMCVVRTMAHAELDALDEIIRKDMLAPKTIDFFPKCCHRTGSDAGHGTVWCENTNSENHGGPCTKHCKDNEE